METAKAILEAAKQASDTAQKPKRARSEEESYFAPEQTPKQKSPDKLPKFEPDNSFMIQRALTHHFGEKNAQEALATYQICQKIPLKSPTVKSYMNFIESLGEVEKLMDQSDGDR